MVFLCCSGKCGLLLFSHPENHLFNCHRTKMTQETRALFEELKNQYPSKELPSDDTPIQGVLTIEGFCCQTCSVPFLSKNEATMRDHCKKHEAINYRPCSFQRRSFQQRTLVSFFPLLPASFPFCWVLFKLIFFLFGELNWLCLI